MADVLITDAEVARLNEARTILDGLEQRADGLMDTYNGGRCAEAADRAKDAIFRALLTCDVYGDANLSPDQLHNEEARRASVAAGGGR